ncbi:MAG: EFR1 family ferrodoxin [Spirochaetales bacterium]|uniref:EFR1 family ferrodoxin n=1 Tax=Candidatus Thalassospirochaeta sargassi TaxID=3119039 RepID=A0AAJ1MK49_9SPIO|nr:EFR1 family ferrodoxin [Spirochaetales bacterium]
MKIASILYFSGTGNTLWASDRFAEHLNSKGIKAEAFSIESDQNILKQRILESDIVFLNYPVYSSDRPEIVKDFINHLPDVAHSEGPKEFGIICTQMLYSGDGAWLEHELIEHKGYEINWAIHLRMPNNVSIPLFPFRSTNDREKLKKILTKADMRLEALSRSVAAEIAELTGTSLLSRLMGLIQREPYRKMFPGWRNDMTIDPFTCTKCGLCIKLCPISNIQFAPEDTGGFPEFNGECNLCLRCYNFCPSQSILYRTKKYKSIDGSLPYRGPTENFNPMRMKQKK